MAVAYGDYLMSFNCMVNLLIKKFSNVSNENKHESEIRCVSRDFEKGPGVGVLYAGLHVWATKKILGFRWSNGEIFLSVFSNFLHFSIQ